ncbi:hypothetical protein FQN60_016187 [Etheostoma spectabile]|uniref:Uncharacterized protein n=1 Tax=Etheostoma spectabile TaxID=54343 RepID=A0A5J5D437_9PERO|nr:hypothetical protein FQN60_016187 [Etheostoma spectabile]
MKLARELELLREKCNVSEYVGSTVYSDEAAAPSDVFSAGAAYSELGAAVSVVTKITEHFLSSHTLKKAQEIEQKSNEITERIQKQFQQLKEKVKKDYNISDPDELDQCFVTEFLGAVAGRQIDSHIAAAGLGLNLIYSDPALIVRVAGIVGNFTLQSSGEELPPLIAKEVEKLVNEMSKTTFKVAFKGGAMVVRGAVGMSFALPEMIDNWIELIEKNHVTEASQSLRDTANANLEMNRILRGQFDDVK